MTETDQRHQWFNG